MPPKSHLLDPIQALSRACRRNAGERGNLAGIGSRITSKSAPCGWQPPESLAR
jgi:hypothetical protein